MEIVKNLPIPDTRTMPIKWPFAKMVTGDCVRITNENDFARARVYASIFSKKSGFKFITRTVDGVLHVWRVA